MGGYPYGSTSSPTHPSNLSQPILPQSQPQPQPSTYSPPQATYQTTESDDLYCRAMFRELGFGESNDGQVFPAVSGCALTMPNGEFIAMSNSSQQQQQQQSVAGYHETPPTHSTNHGGYTHSNGHSSRYHPYPSPSYTSHSSHPSYSGLAAR